MLDAFKFSCVCTLKPNVDKSLTILLSSNYATSTLIGLPFAFTLFAKFLVLLPILSYFGKNLIVISAEAAGAVTKVKVVPETV